MDDEPFLETCLDDKRKEVRDVARGLLMRLENSRFVGRMWVRVKPLVRMKSKFLGGDALDLSLPEGLDAAARRDGLGGALLRKKMGEKANVLAQMLAYTPPALWSQEFNRPPEKLVELAMSSQWKEALLPGWALAAQGARDAAWAQSILRLTTTKAEFQSMFEPETLQTLIMLLSPQQVQAIAQSSIKSFLNELKDDSPLLSFLQVYCRPWTPDLARTVIQSAQHQAGKGWRLAHALPEFAKYVPSELMEELARGWPNETSALWNAKIDEFLMILKFRNEIRRSLEEQP